MGRSIFAHPVPVSGYSISPEQLIQLLHHLDPNDDLKLPYEAGGMRLWVSAACYVDAVLDKMGIRANFRPIRTNGLSQKEADKWLFWTRMERKKTGPWEEEPVDLEIQQQLRSALGVQGDMQWTTELVRL